MFYKKVKTISLAFVLILSLVTGCSSPTGQTTSSSQDVQPSSSEVQSQPESSEATEIITTRIGSLKGPSSLGMLELMDKNEQKTTGNVYDFTVAGAPTDIQAKFLNGELDIAAMPINMAAALYNKTEKGVTVIAVSTLGVLYLLTKGEDITTFSQLEGKTIYATGQGATPEYVLNYLIDKNGLKGKVNVEFKAEHSELAALIATGEAPIAMLPQPFVTTVTSKDADVKVAIDLNEEWRKASNNTELAMTCIVVRNEFLGSNKQAVDTFLKEYKESTEFVNANVDAAAALSQKFDIIPEAVAKKAIPNCAIVFIAGDAMKASANPVLEVLNAANPQSIGGALPDDAFYYKG